MGNVIYDKDLLDDFIDWLRFIEEGEDITISSLIENSDKYLDRFLAERR